jgi:chromosome segregation ATPase
MQSIEKQDFINQIKKQQDKEDFLSQKIFECEKTLKILKQKEENFAKLSNEFFQKEAERINFIKQQNKEIDNLKNEKKDLHGIINEKENQILSKANEVNDLYQTKSNYESKIIAFSNEIQRERDNNRELLLKLEIMNSEYDLKLKLDLNQINHLNKNINQLNNEIKFNKENSIFQLQKFENKISEIQVERDLLKSQNELLNSQIISLKKYTQMKEAEQDEKNNQKEKLQKDLKRLNNELHIINETINERDMEIAKIYKYKENFDKYTYIEKNLDIFNIINAADLFTLQNEFRKLYVLNKENKLQLENFNSIHEILRSDSQELAVLKEKFRQIDSELNIAKKELFEIKLENCEIKKFKEDLKNENILLKELKSRVSEQNKKLLLDMKLNQSSFNILNSSIDKTKKDYERFLYNNIEDLESKNSELHNSNIKLTNQLDRVANEKEECSEAMKEKDLVLKEQKEYIENLENNLREINSKVNSISYYEQCGLGQGYANGESYYLKDEIDRNHYKLEVSQILIDELKAKVNLYEKQIIDYNDRIHKYNEESLNLRNEKHSLVGEVNYHKNQFSSINLKISNLENQILIKDNYINATNYENLELKKNLDNLRKQKEVIFEEISNNSKEAINKLNENKQIFLEKIEKLMNENNLLNNALKEINENISLVIPKEISNENKDPNNKPEIQDNTNDNRDLINDSLINNFGSLHNLLSLIDHSDREIFFSIKFNENYNEKKEIINKKFQILKKILQLADRSINGNLDNKLKFENLNSIIFNLQYKCDLFQNRIIHLENIIKCISEKKEPESSISEIKKNQQENNFMEIDFMSNNETGIKKPKDPPQLKIINSILITSSNKIFSKSDLEKENNNESNQNKQDSYKISFIENREFLKKYFEVLRQNDSYRIVNMELNAKITEVKKQNEELINKKFDSGVTSSNTSKFFFEKYNELLVEKVNLESQLAKEKNEFEKLHTETVNVNREISNLKIKKKDMEKMFSALEKKFNEEKENNIKTQEKLMKQIEEFNLNIQGFQKEKTNFNNVFSKIRNDKVNLENINKNNLTEITSLKENILHKEEMLNTLKNEIENLNKKISENNQQKNELEAKLKSSGDSKNNIWVKKLITILYKSKGIIEMFIQLKNSFEEKIKNYESTINLIPEANQVITANKQAESLIANNIFVSAVNEINAKMHKYENEIRQNKKREESLEKKIAQFANEISLLHDKEKIIGNDYKTLREKVNADAKNRQNAASEVSQAKPAGPGQEIKIYFSKLVQHITTAKNIINFKDGIIKKLEIEVHDLNTKLLEG